jgi:tetratricopeptide (TPR) repeat protein
MYVRRDLSRSLYRPGRRSRLPLVLAWMVALVGLIALVYARFDDLQAATLQMTGFGPAPTAFPSDYALSGMEKFASGDLRGAADDLRRAVEQRPDNVDYLYEYGRVLIEIDRTADAVAVADQAIAADPNDVRGYALKALALRWTSSAEAVQVALAGQKIDPNFAPLYAALTVAYTQIGRFNLALEAADRGLELDDKSPDVHRAIAYPLVLVGRAAEAIEHLEMVTMISPQLPGPWFELAAEYKSPRFNQNQYAIDLYEYMINTLDLNDEDLAKANLRICETIAGDDRAKFDLAERYCRRALEILPDYGSAYRELGRMQYNRRNYEGSIQSFETCAGFQEGFEPARKDIECWALRGLAHYWMNECEDAWNVLSDALTLSGQQGRADEIAVQINTGLYNVTQRCVGYDNLPTPTPIPPTPIPPTPIGGL